MYVFRTLVNISSVMLNTSVLKSKNRNEYNPDEQSKTKQKWCSKHSPLQLAAAKRFRTANYMRLGSQ